MIEGENAFGGAVSGPAVVATSHEEISEMEALAPTIQTYGEAEPYSQDGVRVGISKIELADRETRLYVTVTNRSGRSFSFYSNMAKLIDNGRQLDPTYEDYGQEISSDIAPGASSEGIIVFPPISRAGKLRVILAGYTGGD